MIYDRFVKGQDGSQSIKTVDEMIAKDRERVLLKEPFTMEGTLISIIIRFTCLHSFNQVEEPFTMKRRVETYIYSHVLSPLSPLCVSR